MNFNRNVKSMVSQDIKALPTPLEPAIFGGKVVGVDYWSMKMKSLRLVDGRENHQPFANWASSAKVRWLFASCENPKTTF